MSTARDDSDALIARGIAAEERHELDEACKEYVAATRTAPDYAKGWLHLGIALAAMSRWNEAIAAYKRAIALEPHNAPAHYNSALASYSAGDMAAAEAGFIEALKYRPSFPDAYAGLADAYEAQGRLQDAASALAKAVAQAPTHVGYLFNLALVQRKSGDLDRAEALLRSLIASHPLSGDLGLELSNVLREKGKHLEACSTLEALIGGSPTVTDASSNLLFTMLFRDDITPEYLFQRHEQVGRLIQEQFPVRYTAYSNAKSPERKLRLGYVSADFKRHPIAFFVLPVIEHHDRSRFEVFCYSNAEGADDLTRDFRNAADAWREIHALDDAAVAQMINNDRIDILVDLAGHSGGNRLGVFAHKPAPVQATWLGYLGTTGVDAVDYRICDVHTDPVGLTEVLHTETLATLPRTQWCYRPRGRTPHVGTPPVLRNGFPTLGSFNQFAKISLSIRSLWVRILARLPEARLLVVGIPEGETQDEFRRWFDEHGVKSARLEMIGRVDLETYLGLYNRVDVALDTGPYSGATTTCDALWMGVPVVTLAGRHSIARSGTSLLTSAGLDELVASSPDEYVNTAVALAADIQRLVTMRRSLHERMRNSPLMDEQGFARNLESLYGKMWAAWCHAS